MEFAPYQASPPESTRRSLTLNRSTSPTVPNYFKPASAYSPSPANPPSTAQSYSPIPQQVSPPPHPWGGGSDSAGTGVNTNSGGVWNSSNVSGFGVNIGGFNNSREMVEQFETSLPLRLDYESMLAYLLLPPAGAVLLLILEHKSDYVRFHAWQSALLFTALAVLHLIFSFSSFLSYTLLMIDLGLILWLAWSAYRDADTLDRYEVPWFGPLASSILDDE